MRKSRRRAKEQDAAKRALAEQFLNAIKPTLKAGELTDSQISVRRAATSMGVLVALKISEGDKVLKPLRSLVNVLLVAENALDRSGRRKIGDAGIYRINAQQKYDAQAKQIFGDNPVYVAVLPRSFWCQPAPRG